MVIPLRIDLSVGRRFGGRGVARSGLSRRLLWPALTTVVMLSITVGLGLWQLQRLEWKRGLLAEIDRGEAAAPVPLGPSPEAFTRVFIEGRFEPSTARYGAEVRSLRTSGPVMGARLITPLDRPGQDTVLVDRGWAPLDFDATPPTGPVRVEGYVRPPEHVGQLGIADDPAARRFYSLDPVAIGMALGLTREAPFTVVALGPPGTVPEPASSLPRPPNDHLTYAITWFGLSIVLVGVFAAYVRQTLGKVTT